MSSKLKQLQARQQEIETELRVKVLEKQLQDVDTINRVVIENEFGERVDRTQALFDGQGISRFAELNASSAPISRPDDRRCGDNWPIWRTEIEHAQIRGICRLLYCIDEVCISALDNLVNYSVGEGLAYEVVPKQIDDPRGNELASLAQKALEHFLEFNKIERERDREEFLRMHRDGEDFVGLFVEKGEELPTARLIDPAFVTEPDQPRALEGHVRHRGDMLDWKYGLAASFKDSTKFKHAFVCWYGDELECEAVPEARLVHAKVNVDSEVKRGLSSAFPIWKNLLNAGKLLNNTVEGSAIQAAIAYIREHGPTVRNDEIEEFVNTQATAYSQAKIGGGSRTAYAKIQRPGAVVDVPNGAKFHAGPLGTPRGQSYVEVIQAALRLVGVRFHQPEYMISGDASNGNYASTMVAEAPFTKSSEARQGVFCSKRKELCEKALALMCSLGVIPVPFKILRKYITVTVTGPEVAVRDRLEAHTIRKDEVEAGIRSRRSWAGEVNLDYDMEREQISREPRQPMPFNIGESWRQYP